MVADASSFWADIQRYEDMLVADPHSYCFAPLSELYRQLGLLDDAISVARKGCDRHPDYFGGFVALGAACYDKGLNVEARRNLERALSLKPDEVRARKLLGQVYVGAGEIVLAKELLGQVLRQNPDDLECELLLRSLCATVAETDEASLPEAEVIEELTEVVDEPLPEAEPVSDRSDRSEWSDQSEEEFWAVEPGEESPQPRSPAGNPLVTATMAELYASQGFIDKALTVYEELLAADPANLPYRSRAASLLDLWERQQAALRPEPPAPAETPGDRDDLENELSSWLDNIRRRRDGV